MSRGVLVVPTLAPVEVVFDGVAPPLGLLSVWRSPIPPTN
jgi:hypothetical protein